MWTKCLGQCLGAGSVDQVFRAVFRGRMCGLSVQGSV